MKIIKIFFAFIFFNLPSLAVEDSSLAIEKFSLPDLKKKAELGDIEAQYNLGNIFQKKGNMVEAKKYFKLAADQGHIFAQNNLGVIFYKQADLVEAKKYFKMAADQGDTFAKKILQNWKD